MSRGLLAVLTVLALSGCSVLEPDAFEGRITDTDGRLCLQTTATAVSCVRADPQLAAAQDRGACVRVQVEDDGGGSMRLASAVEPLDDGCQFPSL
jgi:hypothetical protein